MGFENVCDYEAGKQDWLANGLPVEGHLAHIASIGQTAHRDVPLCHLDEKLSDVAERLKRSNGDECVVVNDSMIVLGLVGKDTWQRADGDVTIEQAMEPGPSTFRPHIPADELFDYMEKKKIRSALVTTTEGKLIGLVRREELKSVASGHEHAARS